MGSPGEPHPADPARRDISIPSAPPIPEPGSRAGEGYPQMRSWMRSGMRSALVGLAIALGGLAFAGEAAANGMISLPIAIELGPQRTGNFGTLEIGEVGGDLLFKITLDTDVLGSKADLHEFYFNLDGGFDADDLAISVVSINGVGGAPKTAFDLDDGGPTRGGAGARFDFSLNFGNGASKKGNERIQSVEFLLDADEDLTLADVLGDASSTGRGLEVLFAAHVAGSGNGNGSASATIGVLVPEPETALLLALGLVGLVVVGRRTPR